MCHSQSDIILFLSNAYAICGNGPLLMFLSSMGKTTLIFSKYCLFLCSVVRFVIDIVKIAFISTRQINYSSCQTDTTLKIRFLMAAKRNLQKIRSATERKYYRDTGEHDIRFIANWKEQNYFIQKVRHLAFVFSCFFL